MSDPDSIERHLANLDSPEPALRRAAIFACAKAAEIRAIPRLRQIAGRDEAIELRYLARKSLFLMSARRSAGVDEELSSQATLNMILNPESALTIFRNLISDKPEHRSSALRAAATMGSRNPRLLDILVERVAEERVPEIRAGLVTVLGVLGSARELPEIVKFLRDEDPRIRASAVEALEMLREPAAFALVIKSLQDPDPHVRCSAVSALHRLGKPNILKCCRAMLEAEEAWLRDAATFCLAASRYPDAVPLLRLALRDPHEPVRFKARRGLRQLAEQGEAAAREALAEAADGEEGEASRELGAALASTSLPSSQSGNLESQDVHERRQATRTLAILGADESQIPDLLKRLEGERDDLTVTSLLASLGSSRHPGVLPALRKHLGHAVAEVRAAAVGALRAMGDPASLDHVVPLASDTSLDVASAAILALEVHHPAASLRALEHLAASADPARRRAAVLVASEMKKPEHRQVLDALCHDAVEEVARTAREARDMEVVDAGPPAAGRPVLKEHELADAGHQPQLERLVTDADPETAALAADAHRMLHADRAAAVPLPAAPTSRSGAYASGSWKAPAGLRSATSPSRSIPAPRAAEAGALGASGQWLRDHGEFALCAVLGIVFMALLVARLRGSTTEPAAKRAAPPRAGALTFATVLSSQDPGEFTGRLVVWHGKITSVAGDRKQLTLASEGGRITVRCDRALDAGCSEGVAVEVEGILSERPAGTSVVLVGRRVTARSVKP